jgi:YHS domain-containing protein
MSLGQSLGKWSVATLLGLGLSAGIAAAAEPAAGEKPKPKPYPLAVCVVSDEKLGTMGEPKAIVYEGREVKFCCPSCEPQFKKDPAKYLKKIDDAAPKPK